MPARPRVPFRRALWTRSFSSFTRKIRWATLVSPGVPQLRLLDVLHPGVTISDGLSLPPDLVGPVWHQGDFFYPRSIIPMPRLVTHIVP